MLLKIVKSDLAKRLLGETQFLTDKPFIYCCNVDEAGLSGSQAYVGESSSMRQRGIAEVVRICAKMEEELNEMDENDRLEFLEEYGVSASGLDQIIQTGYRTLGLISYFTQGPKESRAWTVCAGDLAPRAAGVIHTDFERGFIRAQVMAYDDFVENDGEVGCREAGLLRTEGRDYVVHDGDVIEFLFNV